MQTRWMLSQMFTDPVHGTTPVCGAYCNAWGCPVFPAAGGWALVQTQCDPHQLEAAGQDTRVIVLPLTYDPAAVPAQVIAAYASMGATAGMSMGSLLSTLALTEPTYAQSL
jgi:hypothetical protein